MTTTVGALALGSFGAAIEGPRQLNLPGPLVSEPAGAAPLTPRRRTLMVVLDGLRADTARTLPHLSALARQGTSLDIWADAPTFSAPQYVALLTGVPPRDSGVRDNAGLRLAGLDSVPAQLQAQGRSAVHFSDDVNWWKQLFGSAWTYAAVAAPSQILERSADALASADFVLIHLCGIDSAGHNFGSTSVNYKEAALDADRQLAALLTAWHYPDSPVVVVADHGHVEAGGHGGEENDVRRTWMVMAGAGVKAGVTLPDGKSLDVAPTVAALLGVPAPGTAEGHTLVHGLTLPAGTVAALEQADGARIDLVNRDVLQARASFRGVEWLARGARGLGVLALLALLFAAQRRFPQPVRWGLITGGAATLATVVGHLVFWGPASFSASSLMGWVAAQAAALSGALGVVAFAYARHRGLRNHNPGDAVALAFSFAVGSMPLAALSFLLVGGFAPRLACEPAWLAAAPMVAYASFVPPAILAFGAALPGLVRAFAFTALREPAPALDPSEAQA